MRLTTFKEGVSLSWSVLPPLLSLSDQNSRQCQDSTLGEHVQKSLKIPCRVLFYFIFFSSKQ